MKFYGIKGKSLNIQQYKILRMKYIEKMWCGVFNISVVSEILIAEIPKFICTWHLMLKWKLSFRCKKKKKNENKDLFWQKIFQHVDCLGHFKWFDQTTEFPLYRVWPSLRRILLIIAFLDWQIDCIYVYGSFGGRLDHVFANINTLYEATQYTKSDVLHFSEDTVAFLLRSVGKTFLYIVKYLFPDFIYVHMNIWNTWIHWKEVADKFCWNYSHIYRIKG